MPTTTDKSIAVLNDLLYREYNYTKEDVLQLYEDIKKEYNEAITNEANIDNLLSKFIVNGNYVGSNNSYGISSYDIDLPTDIEEYQNAIAILNTDIEELDALVTKIRHCLSMIMQVEPDEELNSIAFDLESKIAELNSIIENREQAISELNVILNNINYQKIFSGGTYGNSQTMGAIGGGGSAGGGSFGGGGGSYNSGGGSNSNNGNNNQSPKIEIGSGLVVNDYSNDGYVPLLEFSGINDLSSIKNSAANLAKHEETVAGILNNVIFNGNVVGSDVYNTKDAGGNADNVNFDAAALYMGIDAVNADIEATTALINQLAEQIDADNQEIEANNQEIESNNEEIASLQEEIAALEASMPSGDDEESAEARAQIEAQIAALQEQIAALDERNAELTEINNQLTAEVEELTAEKENYEEKKTEKEGVFKELVGIRNAYEKACGNILELYAASGLLNNYDINGDDASLYGMELTNEQKSDLFGNIEAMLERNKDSYSLEGNEFSGLNSSDLKESYDSLIQGSKDAKARFDAYSDGKLSFNGSNQSSAMGGGSDNTYGRGLSGLGTGAKGASAVGQIDDEKSDNKQDKSADTKKAKGKYGEKLKSLESLVDGTGYIRTPDKLIVFNQRGYYDENNNWRSWGNGQNGWGKSIAGSGCGPTSLATCLANMLNDPSITPSVIANQMTNYDQNNGGGFMTICKNYGLDYQMSGRYLHEKDANGNYSIDNFLSRGGCLIISVRDSSHYVPIIGIDNSDGSNKYIIADPNANNVGQTMSLSLDQIDQFYGNHTMVMWVAPQGMSVAQAAAPLKYQI